MPTPKQSSIVTCIYCSLEKESSREHVVQDALGGVDFLTTVCTDCNRAMSGIDDMLATKSPLSLLVRRELNGTGPNSWDVDDARNRLLLEARQTPGRDSMTLMPQVIFDGSERLLYFDEDDAAALGTESLQERFYSRLRNAYEHFKVYGPSAKKKDHKNRDMLKLRHVKTVREKYRFPPRICCQQAIRAFKKPVMFELRYRSEEDCHRTLDTLGKLKWHSRTAVSKMQLGSHEPEIHFSYCVTDTLRALAKIGFNLLAYHCSNTAPSRTTFLRTVEWILDGKHADEFGDVTRYGFVEPESGQPLNCPFGSHMFRLGALTYRRERGRSTPHFSVEKRLPTFHSAARARSHGP